VKNLQRFSSSALQRLRSHASDVQKHMENRRPANASAARRKRRT
jgi:hypothetical protein